MSGRTKLLLLLVTLCFVGYAGFAEPESRIATEAGRSPTLPVPREPPDVQATLPTLDSATAIQVRVRAKRQQVRVGESITITIDNNANDPIRFVESCSLQLCAEFGEDWICVERECDGPMTILQPGECLEIQQEVQSLDPAAAELRSRFKLYYQIVSDGPYHFAHSNEITISDATSAD